MLLSISWPVSVLSLIKYGLKNLPGLVLQGTPVIEGDVPNYKVGLQSYFFVSNEH